jgi:hypothetical protein
LAVRPSDPPVLVAAFLLVLAVLVGAVLWALFGGRK